MIDYVRGRLAVALPGRVILDVGGIGLSIETPVSSAGEFVLQVGQEVTLYTRLVLKEDDASIYGFHGPGERNLFNLITGVAGFGPRLTLALLGSLTISQFYRAVMEENIALLCQAPGVGRKGAQRLILELKEKLPKVMELEAVEIDSTPSGAVSFKEEIVEALCALGYSRVEAVTAVRQASAAEQQELSREELLKQALKCIAGR